MRETNYILLFRHRQNYMKSGINTAADRLVINNNKKLDSFLSDVT